MPAEEKYLKELLKIWHKNNHDHTGIDDKHNAFEEFEKREDKVTDEKIP